MRRTGEQIGNLMIQTATGAIEADELGFCLMHEHVQVSWPPMNQQYPGVFNPDDVLRRAVARLEVASATGVNTIVDLTPIDLGRDAALIRKASETTGIQIVVSTGFFYGTPYYFWMRPTSEIVDFMVNEIRKGISDTGVRAGAIKCATNGSISKMEERTLRACARAHRATGVPIFTHTDASQRDGILQQEIFSDEGVNLSGTVIGHSDDADDLEYVEQLIAAGSWVGLDRFGVQTPYTTEQRVERLGELIARGHTNQIVISHDACGFMQWLSDPDRIEDVAPSFGLIGEDVLPALRAGGVEDVTIQQIIVENPRRILSGLAPY